ncbi:hypothetical protein ABK01_01235 [Treponema sp. OMZ 305]|uniref:adenine-specific methyltransferase EcoRI family protein n=1 Tax=Treponema sp. OMZ 305 TaxID=1659192 RepID=UPI0020A5EE78|nr:adenine-specific methyltransferase EcoRI family protein [Treponema sp. OMZ 305]UTC57024.1 hypothetical protein ABK01_01235 [Treponema sp. OMZ 305]
MANKNTNLHKAKRFKDDEFYTTYETVENELSHYIGQFKNKTVLCNCDNPFTSNFSKYFIQNFNLLGLFTYNVHYFVQKQQEKIFASYCG